MASLPADSSRGRYPIRDPVVSGQSRQRPAFSQEHFDAEFGATSKHLRPGVLALARRVLGRKRKRFKTRILAYVPILAWVKSYSVKKDLLPDVLTGITVAVFHVPQSFGYSLLAGVSPVYGLYTSLFPMIMYAIFGSSRHASIGAFAVVSIMTGSLVESNKEQFTAAQVASTLSFLVGIYQLVFGLLQLGGLSNFLSEQLVSGFTAGVSVHIGSSQLAGLFGINVTLYSGPFLLVKTFAEFLSRLKQTHLPTLALSASSLLVMGLVKVTLDPLLISKIGIPVPIEMVVVIVGTLLSSHLNLEGYNITVIQEISHESPRPHLPVFSPHLLSNLAVPALAVAVVSYAITISIARLFARKQNYKIDPNQEFIALGASNLFGSFFTCFPVGASVPRSSIQAGAGGKTQLVSFINSLLILIVILCFGHYFERLPIAILSSIIFISLKKVFMQVKEFKTFWDISRIDGNVWMVSFLATIIVDVQFGLIIGVSFSLFVLIYQIRSPKTYLLGNIPNTDFYVPLNKYNMAVEIPGVKVFHFGGPLHFANSSYFCSRLARTTHVNVRNVLKGKKARRDVIAAYNGTATPRGPSFTSFPVNHETSFEAGISVATVSPNNLPSYIILDFSRVAFVDGTSIMTLIQIVQEYQNISITIYMAACSSSVLSMLQRGGMFKTLPSSNFFPSVHDAVMHTVPGKKRSIEAEHQPKAFPFWEMH
ncbi:prestin-like [Ornithodoros turicata]|uniref:prestin-like n=1 Tax=Ornithodoros turicata TaxID=34597 RepID=UPI0031399E25